VHELDYKTIRYPGHALQMKFLLSLGFAENRAIDVRTHLTYRDVLVRKLSQRMRGDFRDVVILRVVITGEKDGTPKSLVYEMIEEHQEGDELSAMQRCTSLPVSVVACQLASQSVPGGGATPPEHVVSPNAYLQEIRERGLSIDVTEHEGHVPIENPEIARQTA
jgi:saccharopine dehydrogenase-like NADP-dependent oxidoreductase